MDRERSHIHRSKTKPAQPESKRRIGERLSMALALPKEIVFNLPLVSLIGNEEMRIENYKGILEYTDALVRMHTSCGILRIEGKRLRLRQITAESISVSGVITRIEFVN